MVDPGLCMGVCPSKVAETQEKETFQGKEGYEEGPEGEDIPHAGPVHQGKGGETDCGL